MSKLNTVRSIVRPRTGLLAAALTLGVLTGCGATQKVKQERSDFSGFLGDYSELTPGKGDEVNFRYIDMAVDWKKFTKVYIKPIELWKADDDKSGLGKLSHEDQQMLVNYFHTSLTEAFGKEYTVVSEAGPDVLVVHAAITQGKKSMPVMNLMSSVVPIGMAVSLGQQAVTGAGTGVGRVSIEAEMLDGQTNKRIFAGVDERAGSKAIRTKFNGTWGDVKEAFDWWSKRATEQLGKLKAGKPLDS